MVKFVAMLVDAIQLFCDVASCRSVSRAAEMHGVTQSAVSQRLQALEKELGVQLIDRSKRPLELTAAGDLYYRGGRRIISSYDRLKRKVTGRGPTAPPGEIRGEVTVSAIYSAGIDLLNQVKAGFEGKYPRAHVALDYLQPDAVYDHVRQQQCDLGIISYPQHWAGVASVPLREEQMVVVARAGNRVIEAEVIHAPELTDVDMVCFDQSLPIARHMKHYFRQHGVRPNVVNEIDNVDTVKTYLAQSDAVGILPLRTVQREIASGVLSATRLEPEVARPLSIVYLRQRPQNPLVKAFIEYLLNNQPPRPSLKATPATPAAV
jgi:DNA-binding transcriptional LysR family regulator